MDAGDSRRATGVETGMANAVGGSLTSGKRAQKKSGRVAHVVMNVQVVRSSRKMSRRC
jgi:hypothetical protein